AVAEVAAVLDEERVARTVAQSLDRRRQHRERETFLDAGELGAEFGVDLLCAAVALVERLEVDEGYAVVGRVDELQRIEAREGDVVLRALDLHRDRADLPQRRVGAF